MACLTLPLADDYTSITRRVVMELVRTLIITLDLEDDILIQFNGQSNQSIMYNSETKKFTSVKEMQDDITFGQGDILRIEFKEAPSDEGLNRNRLIGDNIPPLWAHDQYLYLKANYMPMSMEISLTYFSANLERTAWFRTRIATILAIDKWTIPVDIAYYIIPQAVNFMILQHCHELIENNKGYGWSYDEWLKKCTLDDSLRKASKLNGKSEYPCFKERQTDLYMTIETRELPEGNKRDQNPGHELGLDIKLQYEKPLSTSLFYPIVIHNQMIKEEYQMPHKHDNPNKQKGVVYSELMGNLRGVYQTYFTGQYTYTKLNGIVVPSGDDWIHPYRSSHRDLLFTGLIQVRPPEEDGKRIISSFKGLLPYLHLSDAFLDYIQTYPEDSILSLRGLMYVRLWRNQKQIGPDSLYIDSDTTIKTDAPLDERDIHHITYEINKDFVLLAPQFFERTAEFPPLVEELYHQFVRYGQRGRVEDVVESIIQQQPHLNRKPNILLPMIANKISSHYPYIRYGIWHTLTNHLVFGMDISKRLLSLVDWFKVSYQDVFYSFKTREQQYQFMEDNRYEIWQGYQQLVNYDKQRPERKKGIKEEFFGKIDILVYKRALVERSIKANYPLSLYRTHNQYNRMAAYICAERRDKE